MPLESATFINDLNIANPVGGTDTKSEGDNHLRLIKTCMKNTFPEAIAARKFRDQTASAADTLSWLLYKKRAAPTVNDLLGSFAVSGDSSTAVERVFGRMQVRADAVANGAENGSLLFKVIADGVAETQVGELNKNGLVQETSMFLQVPANITYRYMISCPFAFTVFETTTFCASGTCTATFQINGVGLGGGAHAVSTTPVTKAHTTANVATIGSNLMVVISANNACLQAILSIKYRRSSFSA